MRLNYRTYFPIILIILFAFILAYREIGGIIFNIDLTFIVLLTTSLSFFYFFFTDKKLNIMPTLFTCMLILGYMSISLLWTRAYDYGFQKILLSAPFLLTTIFIQKPLLIHVKAFRFIIFILALYTIFYVNFIENFSFTATRLKAAEETNPIKLAKFFGFAIISISFSISEMKVVKLWKYVGLVLLVLIFGSGMILSGSKGPLFALILTLVLIKLSSSKYFLFKFVVLLLSYIFFMEFIQNLLEYFPSDFRNFINDRFNVIDDKYDSVSTRTNMIMFGINNFSDRGLFYVIFGNGIGDYSYAYKYAMYPHNILIEFLFEFGLLGLIILLSMLIYLFTTIKRYKSLNFTTKYLYFSCVFFVFNAMSTGDFAGNYLLFSFFILIVLNNKNVRNKYRTSIESTS